MKPKNTKTDRIRRLLYEHGSGLPAQTIADRLAINPNLIRVMLNQMPDSYIDRWELTEAGRGCIAIWNVAHIPPDAPRPDVATLDQTVQKAHRKKRMSAKKAKAITPAKPATPEPPKTPKTRWAFPPPWAN